MKKTLSAVLFLAILGCMHSAVLAAELLDVKPVIAGNAVSVEISADIAMTYTYYKVPGQARAVVDIAEADPEKVEPLIVVNKGAVSSISVDKAQISGIVVSRIIFNLVSESDISVTASPDRKLLTVTFGGPAAAGKPEPKSEPKPVPPPEPVAKVEPPAIAAATPPAGAGLEEDPLGLDEPAAKSAAPLTTAVAAASEVPLSAAPTVMRIPKLGPVVPALSAPALPSALTITGIATGGSYIEIRANQPVADYKTIRLSSPERLVIDIAGAKKQLKSKSFMINKFGITKVRIGEAPDHIRVVIDSGKVAFPAHTITNTEDGLRINFK
ncbi:MAG: AMIN domain-containing protein [Desulfuromonadaceae bacterium]